MKITSIKNQNIQPLTNLIQFILVFLIEFVKIIIAGNYIIIPAILYCYILLGISIYCIQ